MHERIYEIAAHVLSIPEDEEALLRTLCAAAETELTLRLREELSPEDCGNVFAFCAALIASSEMMLLRSANSVEQFTAGDVSIRHNSEKASLAAAALRRQADSLMAPFCSDGSFAFMGVQG